MNPGLPSLTARRAAAHRALHQTLESGRLFADPFAGPILGEPPEALLRSDALGFDEIEDLGPGDIAARYFRVARREGPGGHLLRARRAG